MVNLFRVIKTSILVLSSTIIVQNATAAGNDWKGGYAGLFAGTSWTDVLVSDDNFHGDSFGNDITGLFTGAQAGYNFQNGNIVFGIEGEIGHLGLKGSQQHPDLIGNPNAEGESVATAEIGLYGSITARLGITAGDALIYGKAGWGAADVDVNYVSTHVEGTTSASKTVSGAVYGGGVEYSLFDGKASIKAEYLHLDFVDTLSHTSTVFTEGTATFNHDLDGIDTFKIGLNIKFD